MLINVKIKKKMFFIGRTDGQTHGQLNYSSEPHNKIYFKFRIQLFHHYAIEIILKKSKRIFNKILTEKV